MSTNELDDLYINRYAGRVENPEEVLMRADFDRVKDLSETAFHAESEEDMDRIFDKVDEITVSWTSRHDDLGAAYRYLRDAYDDWKSAPDAMRRLHAQIAADEAQGIRVLSGIEWRSQQHARELTGNGAWVVEPHSVEQAPQQLAAAERRDSWSDPAEANPNAAPVPVSSSFAAARTAELAEQRHPIPGHAFAGLVNGRAQGQEMER
ncbi:hypothetical protein U3653_20270 [Nocardia sp. CDC186]|uniref:Uncharacterized protein n=1 Tax=Nocardia implantans TaxID=3108168 RepID=A0ABU6AXZ4_9NOCA|nr:MULTISPECIES: hypothetical protein [unclassified Nocardia]MBF6190564.1 hypothetical protein [Nocardia beijingensis]MEA3528477.1 hypothetical protein [Nocardia sp. CDC192]MEB3512371.1 hypothetical protein [Nocardia sp. CDC186]